MQNLRKLISFHISYSNWNGRWHILRIMRSWRTRCTWSRTMMNWRLLRSTPKKFKNSSVGSKNHNIWRKLNILSSVRSVPIKITILQRRGISSVKVHLFAILAKASWTSKPFLSLKCWRWWKSNSSLKSGDQSKQSSPSIIAISKIK